MNEGAGIFQIYPDIAETFPMGAGKNRQPLRAQAMRLGELLSAPEKPDSVEVVAVLNFVPRGATVVILKADDHYYQASYREKKVGWAPSAMPEAFLQVEFHNSWAYYAVPVWIAAVLAGMSERGEVNYRREEYEAMNNAAYAAERQRRYDAVATGRAETPDEVL